MTGKDRQKWTPLVVWLAGTLAVGGFSCCTVFAQTQAHIQAQTAVPSPATSQLIQQAQTVSIPIHAFSQVDISPITDLKPSDLVLDVDGKPANFQLSRPWSNTINPKTGQAEDQPNLLIILPLAAPLDRNDVINEAVYALKTAPPSGWNISILDDSGNQTAYTRQIPLVITELEKIGAENPAPTDLIAWRHTACIAIASMRDLPGRRVVLSLGDLFHEMVYQGYDLVYQNFDVRDVSIAARAAGAVIYSAESSREIEALRRLPAPYSVLGSGPWMLVADHNALAGWLSGTIADTLQQIRKNGIAAYNMDLYLDLKQMDGLPHTVSVTPQRRQTIVDAPTFYIAPNLAQLQELSLGSAALRQALKTPPTNTAAPLQIGTQVEYFPHPDGKSGTQIISTGLFWAPATPPPTPVELAQQL